MDAVKTGTAIETLIDSLLILQSFFFLAGIRQATITADRAGVHAAEKQLGECPDCLAEIAWRCGLNANEKLRTMGEESTVYGQSILCLCKKCAKRACVYFKKETKK